MDHYEQNPPPAFKDQMRGDDHHPKPNDDAAAAMSRPNVAVTVIPIIEAHPVDTSSAMMDHHHPASSSRTSTNNNNNAHNDMEQGQEDEDLSEMRRRIQAKKERLELLRLEAEMDRELYGDHNHDGDTGTSSHPNSKESSRRTTKHLISSSSSLAAVVVLIVVVLMVSLVGGICGTGHCGGNRSSNTKNSEANARSNENAQNSSPTAATTTTANPNNPSFIAANVLCDTAIRLESTTTNVQGNLEMATAGSGFTSLCHGHDQGLAHQDPGLFYVVRAGLGSFMSFIVCGSVGDLSMSIGNNGCTEDCAAAVEEKRLVIDGSYCHKMEVATTPGSDYTILVYGSGGAFDLKVNPSMLPDNAVCTGATSLQTSFLSPDREPFQGDLALGFIDKSLYSLCHGHNSGSAPDGPGLWYKFQAGESAFSTVKVCSTFSDVSISAGAGCDGGCAEMVRDQRITENTMFCHQMDLKTSVGDEIVFLVYGSPEEFTVQAYPSDLPKNAVCEGGLFIANSPNLVNQGTQGNLSLGFVDPMLTSVCHGHDSNSATTGPGLWYKTQAAGSGSAFTAAKVCGTIVDLSLSVGSNGCNGGCATVVNEERTTENGRYCHQIDFVASAGDDVVMLVYGNTDIFDVQAYESTLPLNVICEGASVIESSVQGHLSSGALTPGISAVCHGLDKGSTPSGKSLWYTFVASSTGTVAIQVCGDAEQISISTGGNGCNGSCASVVSDTRLVQNALFCHRMVIETTVGNSIVILVYGMADSFTLTVSPP